jgi:hypothetical protein
MSKSQSSNGQHHEETPASSAGSVTKAIRILRRGKDERAAAFLVERYFARLERLAYPIVRWPDGQARAEDEQDAALAALTDVCLDLAKGLYLERDDREGLWLRLAQITERKAFRQLHRKKKFEPLPDGPDGVVSVEPTPEYEALVKLTIDQLKDEADNDLQRLALQLRLEGYTVREIALRVRRTRQCVNLWFQKIELQWVERHGESPIPE